MSQEPEKDGALVTLEPFDQLREDCRKLWANSSELCFLIDKTLRELENPNLHDVLPASAFRIELWDRYGKSHLRWTVAAAANITVGHAAFDAAVGQYAGERLTLRKGALVIRKHPKE
jgi:hypothetical protein